MSRLIQAVVVALLGALVAAFVGDRRSPPPVACQKATVDEPRIVYETPDSAYTEEVMKDDACGKPYTVRVTRTRQVEVPVKKSVPVTKWVKESE
jgi:hypothetical protein